MDFNFAINRIEQALQNSKPGMAAQQKMLARPLKPVELPPLVTDAQAAAVLILLHPNDDDIYFYLTERTEDVEKHKGQVSLPGGAQENGEALAITACRETEEEIGLPAEQIRVIGELSTLPVPVSGFMIHPFVGWIDSAAEAKPEPREVKTLFTASLTELLDNSKEEFEQRVIRGYDVHVPYFLFSGHKVWGATAMILAEFKQILRGLEQ